MFFKRNKKEVPENAFSNFTALSSFSNKMSGGVALLFRYNVAYAQIKSLETKDNNNIIAAALFRGLKTSTAAAYKNLRRKVNSLNS